MTYSEAGYALTKSFEGCRLTAYRDQGGVLTIAYGHTKGVKAGDTCTQEQADAWLQEELESAAGFVRNSIDVELTQGQFDALVDFTYNLGPGALKYSTLRALINSGQMDRAAGQFQRWNHVNKVEVEGLTRRRAAERNLFEGKPWDK